MSLDPQVERYFKLLHEKKYKEAEEILGELRQVMDKSKKEKGYWQALEGLLLTHKSNGDKNLHVPKAVASKDSVEEARKEFSAHARNALHDEYDRGYFQALLDYLTVTHPPS